MKRSAFWTATIFASALLISLILLLSVRAELRRQVRNRELITVIESRDYRKAQELLTEGADGAPELVSGPPPGFGDAWKALKERWTHSTLPQPANKRISGLDMLMAANPGPGQQGGPTVTDFENLAYALLNAGAATYNKDSMGRTLLDIAVQCHMHQLVKQIVGHPFEQNAYRNLCLADHEDGLTLLINGVSANVTDPDTGRTPLFDSDRQRAELLLANGGNINATARDASSPLFCFCASGNEDMITLLLNKSATVDDVLPASGISTLMMAAAHCHLPIVKRIHALGGEAQARTRWGDTLLMFAVCGPDTDTIKWVLDTFRSTDVNQEGSSGCRALDIVNQRLVTANSEQERSRLQAAAALLKAHGATATGASKRWNLDNYTPPNRSMAPRAQQ